MSRSRLTGARCAALYLRQGTSGLPAAPIEYRPRGGLLLGSFQDLALSLRVFVKSLLPVGTMLRWRDLHGRDFVLGAVGRPVAVLGGHDIGTGLGIVERRVDNARLYACGYRCARG